MFNEDLAKEISEARMKEKKADLMKDIIEDPDMPEDVKAMLSLTDTLMESFNDTMGYMGKKLEKTDGNMPLEDVMFASKIMVNSMKIQATLEKLRPDMENK